MIMFFEVLVRCTVLVLQICFFLRIFSSHVEFENIVCLLTGVEGFSS